MKYLQVNLMDALEEATLCTEYFDSTEWCQRDVGVLRKIADLIERELGHVPPNQSLQTDVKRCQCPDGQDGACEWNVDQNCMWGRG